MDQAEARPAAPQYRAFISYSHADARFGGWLHRRLENARLPDGSRLAPIFIDRAELAAGSDLSAQVRDALSRSAALVVVASPAARASRWVGQEIELFRELHPERPILATLVASEPDEAFPPALLGQAGRTLEPLAADFREGQDGKRLGLLKIVAGLTGQPLDRLVQRDAQARQRRVMAVTAGAVALVLILSTALVFALRARAEAERQRAEAEGLVEFMLTDLRDKLTGVGRIDVMDAVNQRAMGYYGDQRDLSALPPDSLDRRARVIEAMGEDDENRGRIDAAFAKYVEHDRIMSALLRQDPDNPDRIFAKASSENRLALIATTRGQLRDALPRFERAEALLARLPQDRTKPVWLGLRALVAGNLCAIALKTGGNPARAVQHCRKAIELTETQIGLTPGTDMARYDLAFHHVWLGAALDAQGDRDGAGKARQRALEISEDLLARDGANMLWREQHMEIAFTLARTARDAGDTRLAAALLARARHDNAVLVGRDPANEYWKQYSDKIAGLEQGGSK